MAGIKEPEIRVSNLGDCDDDDKEVFDIIISKVWTTKKSTLIYFIKPYIERKDSNFINELKISYLDDNNYIPVNTDQDMPNPFGSTMSNFRSNLSEKSKVNSNIKKSFTTKLDNDVLRSSGTTFIILIFIDLTMKTQVRKKSNEYSTPSKFKPNKELIDYENIKSMELSNNIL